MLLSTRNPEATLSLFEGNFHLWFEEDFQHRLVPIEKILCHFVVLGFGIRHFTNALIVEEEYLRSGVGQENGGVGGDNEL